MKIYTLNSRPDEQMTLDDVVEWLQENCFFRLDEVCSVKETEAQSTMIEVLIDAYFTVEEIDEEDNIWEDDREEREDEYRREQL